MFLTIKAHRRFCQSQTRILVGNSGSIKGICGRITEVLLTHITEPRLRSGPLEPPRTINSKVSGEQGIGLRSIVPEVCLGGRRRSIESVRLITTCKAAALICIDIITITIRLEPVGIEARHARLIINLALIITLLGIVAVESLKLLIS